MSTLTLYTRTTSNNSGRLSLYVSLISPPSSAITTVNVLHSDQKEAVSTATKGSGGEGGGKIPFVVTEDGGVLGESAVILRYLVSVFGTGGEFGFEVSMEGKVKLVGAWGGG